MSIEWQTFLTAAALIWIVIAVVVGAAVGSVIAFGNRNAPRPPGCQAGHADEQERQP